MPLLGQRPHPPPPTDLGACRGRGAAGGDAGDGPAGEAQRGAAAGGAGAAGRHCGPGAGPTLPGGRPGHPEACVGVAVLSVNACVLHVYTET